jgi:hypothetical protein
MQCCYNGLKIRGLFSFHHGDALLFVLGSAHVMYAYMLHPTTIPPEYYKFMLKTAVIPHNVLELNRKCARRQPISVEEIVKVATSLKAPRETFKKALQFQPLEAILPCWIIHPHSSHCSLYCLKLWRHVFTHIFPVYLTLNVVPMVVLRLKRFLSE